MTDAPPTVTVAPIPALPRLGLRQRATDWLKQVGTQKGLALMLSGIVLAALHPFDSAEAIGGTLIAAGLPLLLPDNTTDAIRARDTANAIAHAAAVRTPAALEAAAQQAVALEATRS